MPRNVLAREGTFARNSIASVFEVGFFPLIFNFNFQFSIFIILLSSFVGVVFVVILLFLLFSFLKVELDQVATF